MKQLMLIGLLFTVFTQYSWAENLPKNINNKITIDKQDIYNKISTNYSIMTSCIQNNKLDTMMNLISNKYTSNKNTKYDFRNKFNNLLTSTRDIEAIIIVENIDYNDGFIVSVTISGCINGMDAKTNKPKYINLSGETIWGLEDGVWKMLGEYKSYLLCKFYPTLLLGMNRN